MLNELLERYWSAAHAEGKEGRDHDTEDGIAQQTLSAIHAEVERLVEEEREACAMVCEVAGVARIATLHDWTRIVGDELAAAIRARSNAIELTGALKARPNDRRE